MKGRDYLVALILLLFVLSCAEDPTPVTPTQRGIETTVRVSPNPVATGQEIEIELDIVNRGHAVALVVSCHESFGFRIRSSTGTIPISFPRSSCVGEADTLRFEEGERRTESFEVDAMLLGGTYEVQAGIVGHEDKLPWATTTLVVEVPDKTCIISGTVAIDTCYTIPESFESTTDTLCGESSQLMVLFDMGGSVELGEVVNGDTHIRTATLRTGPTQWAFVNPRFEDELVYRFAGRAVIIKERRTEGPGVDDREITVQVYWNRGGEDYSLKIEADYEFPIDAEGYPVLESGMDLIGDFAVNQRRSFFLDEVGYALGSAAISIEHMRDIEVVDLP